MDPVGGWEVRVRAGVRDRWGSLGSRSAGVHGGPTLAQVTFHLTLNLSDPAHAWTPMEDESNSQAKRGTLRNFNGFTAFTKTAF